MKIVASNIPAYYPSGYNEQLYLVDKRSITTKRDIEIAESSVKLRVKNDATYESRKIQSVFYDQYTLTFITTENIDVGILEIAGELTITQDNGEIHQAKIINISDAVKLQNTEFLEYIIIYKDLNSKVTVNHLTYDSSINPDYMVRFYYRSFLNSNPVESIRTPIYPDFSVTDFEVTSNSDNKIEIISSENAFRTIKMQFYLDEDTKNAILKSITYDNFLNKAGLFDSGFYAVVGSTPYVAKELPIVEVEDSQLEGLYPVNITIKYLQILNFPYE